MSGIMPASLVVPSNDWDSGEFGSILAESVRNGIYKKKEFHGNGCKIVNMGELFAFDRISDQDMKRIELTDKERSKYLLQNGDLLFARRSLVLEGSGKCSIVVQPVEEVTFESSIIRARLDQKKAEPKFFYYFWGSPQGRALMTSIATRTAVSGIRGSDLVRLEVPIPPLPTQRRIAGILSAYDDLIENNARRIAILEEMAQLIYREWFVRYRFPGHEEVEMVESELGLMPEGWEVKRLGDIAEEMRRGVKPDQVDPQAPYLGLEHLPRKSIALSDWNMAKNANSNKLAFQRGEILFGKIRPYFHKVGIAPLDGICSTDIIVIVPKRLDYYFLVLACVSSEMFVEYATQTSQGTKMPRADWKILVEYPIAIPPKPLLIRFNELMQNIVDQIQNMIFRNRNLRRTRDLLLPRLVSGEVEV